MYIAIGLSPDIRENILYKRLQEGKRSAPGLDMQVESFQFGGYIACYSRGTVAVAPDIGVQAYAAQFLILRGQNVGTAQ